MPTAAAIGRRDSPGTRLGLRALIGTATTSRKLGFPLTISRHLPAAPVGAHPTWLPKIALGRAIDLRKGRLHLVANRVLPASGTHSRFVAARSAMRSAAAAVASTAAVSFINCASWRSSEASCLLNGVRSRTAMS